MAGSFSLEELLCGVDEETTETLGLLRRERMPRERCRYVEESGTRVAESAGVGVWRFKSEFLSLKWDKSAFTSSPKAI